MLLDKPQEEGLSYPSMAQLRLMGPPTHVGSSDYVNGRHIKRVRIRNMPDDPTESPQLAKIKVGNWLKLLIYASLIS